MIADLNPLLTVYAKTHFVLKSALCKLFYVKMLVNRITGQVDPYRWNIVLNICIGC